MGKPMKEPESNVTLSTAFRRCLRDSRFLFENGRSESAFILSVLAAEELSKCVILEWNKIFSACFPTRNHKIKQGAFGALSTAITLQDKMLVWAEKNGFAIAHQQKIDSLGEVETEELTEQVDLISFIANSRDLQREMRIRSTYIMGTLEQLKHGLLYGDFGIDESDTFEQADYTPSAEQMLRDIDDLTERLETEHAGLLLVLSHSIFESWVTKKGT